MLTIQRKELIERLARIGSTISENCSIQSVGMFINDCSDEFQLSAEEQKKLLEGIVEHSIANDKRRKK